MNIGTATVKTLGKDGVFLTIPVDNPALGYADYVALVTKTLQEATHVIGIGKELEAEPANLAYSLEIDAETNALYVDFEDAGNAKEAYEFKVYLIADLEETA
jgi:hypothetical protein